MGVTPILKTKYVGSFDKNYTMIAAADINGFINSACDLIMQESGRNDTDPYRGTVDRNRFELWVEHCLVPVLGNYQRREPRSIVVLDNASVHHSERVVEMIREKGAFVVYLPPYSPDFNPIELMFNMYKMKIAREIRQHSMLEAHITALDCVEPHHARNLFRKSKVPGDYPDDDEEDNDVEDVVAISYLMSGAAYASSNFLLAAIKKIRSLKHE